MTRKTVISAEGKGTDGSNHAHGAHTNHPSIYQDYRHSKTHASMPPSTLPGIRGQKKKKSAKGRCHDASEICMTENQPIQKYLLEIPIVHGGTDI